MKKTIKVVAVFVVCLFGTLSMINEVETVKVQRSTCAYVLGAKKNGAITPDEYEALYALADSWHPHVTVRLDRCKRVRRMVECAYREQREREEQQPKEYNRLDYFSFKVAE